MRAAEKLRWGLAVMPSAQISGLSLRCLLSSPPFMSVPENREPGALGTHCFRNCLSLDSTRRVRPFWLPGWGKEDSDRHVSLSSCVSLHLSLCK